MRLEYRPLAASEYRTLRDRIGWWKTDTVATETALQHSLFSVVALEDGKVAGFGRVVGDGGLYFYIQDVMVHPELQGKGLGRSLMKELMNYIRTHARAGAFVGLMAAKGLESYYEAFGFRARDKDAPGMALVIE
ncbi:MAG: GNAT family N-acetyltransferase [Deltaproteobacteria bacterium]|nr:GNAT family N-acetyltransferase [Deltaproteobacteria bacterium]